MLITYLVVLFVVVGVGYAIAFSRKGKVSSATMGSRQLEVHTLASPDQAFAAIAAIGRPYAVDDRDPGAKIVVLSSPVTFFTWGFLYPVFIHAEGAGSRIQVGCHSKFIQMGPLVTSAHRACVAAIEQTLSLPTARVA